MSDEGPDEIPPIDGDQELDDSVLADLGEFEDLDEQGFETVLARLGLDGADFGDVDEELLETLPVVAVVGRPNVGKSTFVNRILGRREAVVQDVPGVTRDRVRYEASWAGRRCILVDAGIR